MDRITAQVGRVVCSTQGRDIGRAFVITQVLDDRFVMIADGQTRKLDHPKKKKLKHLHLKPVLMEHMAEALASGQLLDAHVRKALQEAGLEVNQPPCKED